MLDFLGLEFDRLETIAEEVVTEIILFRRVSKNDLKWGREGRKPEGRRRTRVRPRHHL